jgi:hypothetical protein
MFLASLKKFNYLRNKHYSLEEYNLSSYELFELILNKKIKKSKFNIFELLINIILFFLSLISIIKCKIRNINNINYFIVFNNDLIDPRSNYISKIKTKKFVNIIKTGDLKLSLKVYYKYENVVFHQSIVFFSRFFFFENKFSLKDKFEFIHKCNLRKNKFYKLIFKFLKIKKLIMIDDYREMQNFITICKKLNIYSIGLMHSRFSKYRVSLKYDCFDKYIVWTEYFKKKLLEINPKYKNKIDIINFRNFKKIIKYKSKTNLNVLFFSDSMMDYKSVKNYLDQIKEKKNINIFLRLKKNQQENRTFLKYISENNFIDTNEKNVKSTVIKYNPSFFLATNSNVLLEASLYNCFPILLKTKNDYSFDLIQDKVVIPYTGNKNFYNFLKNLNNKKSMINKIFNKLWKKKNKNKNLIKILN